MLALLRSIIYEVNSLTRCVGGGSCRASRGFAVPLSILSFSAGFFVHTSVTGLHSRGHNIPRAMSI